MALMDKYLFKTRAGYSQPGYCQECKKDGVLKRYQFANKIWHVFFFCPVCEDKISGSISREELQKNGIDLMSLPVFDKDAVTKEINDRVPPCPCCEARPVIAKKGKGDKTRLVWFCRVCAVVAGDLGERDKQLHIQRLKYIESVETYEFRMMPYEEYLQTNHWQRMRYCAQWMADFRCQLCGALENLQVHHSTYRRLGNERPEDLIVLCRRCHSTHHHSLETRPEHGQTP
jgi:5-methylcytosine-specific restriction endonuclease McrA